MFSNAKKGIAVFTAFFMLFTSWGAVATQEELEVNQYSQLFPIMDLVCAASLYSQQAPEHISGDGNALQPSFVESFFQVGQTQGAQLGITSNTLSNTQEQTQILDSLFSASLPALQPIPAFEGTRPYIGFKPLSVTHGEDESSVQMIGEVYSATSALSTLDNLESVEWFERAFFELQRDHEAKYGYRIVRFSTGSQTGIETTMETYYGEIVMEYISNLGFSILYPSVFNGYVTENEQGITGALPDQSATFFAKRLANTKNNTVEEYIASSTTAQAKTEVNTLLQSGTVSYATNDGYIIHDIYIVSVQYVYHAQLRYRTELENDYAMFTEYMENSFVAHELSQG